MEPDRSRPRGRVETGPTPVAPPAKEAVDQADEPVRRGGSRRFPPPEKHWKAFPWIAGALAGLAFLGATHFGSVSEYACRMPVPIPFCEVVPAQLLLTDAGVDKIATAQLAAGQIPDVLRGMQAGSTGQRQQAAVNLPPQAAPQAGPAPEAQTQPPPQQVAAVTAPVVQEAVAANRTKLFTFQIFDTMDEDDDEVTIFVDGQNYGTYELFHANTTLTVALAKGSTARVEIAATHDGGGGVTFGLRGADGEIKTRGMDVGQSESFVLRYQ